jgi:hypothetical protein
MTKKEQTITLPLVDLIEALIGKPSSAIENTEISFDMGLIFHEKLKSVPGLAIVTFKDFDDTPNVRLWNILAYRLRLEMHKSQESYKHKQRVKLDIEMANHKILTTALASKMSLTEEQVINLSYKLLKSGNEMLFKALGLNVTLITKEEELS